MSNRGADLRYNLEISFEEAAFGCRPKVPIPRPKKCDTCSGSGSKSGAAPKACGTCGGSGELRFTQGFFAVSRPCTDCSGTGAVVPDPCGKCRGSGKVPSEEVIEVNIPAGVDNGTRVRLGGMGEPGDRGGPPGDLYVTVIVREHPLFQREDYDVFCEVPISFTQAALGAKIDVPTLDGKVKMTIPEGTQSGKVFRLKGKGIPHLHSGQRGDQHVRVVVETPTGLTAKQRELLEKFAELQRGGVHPQSKNFFDEGARAVRLKSPLPSGEGPGEGAADHGVRAPFSISTGPYCTVTISERAIAPVMGMGTRKACRRTSLPGVVFRSKTKTYVWPEVSRPGGSRTRVSFVRTEPTGWLSVAGPSTTSSSMVTM